MSASPSTRRLPVIWMTFLDGRDHAVCDEEVAQCTSGLYQTVCGAVRLPASSHAVPRPPCHRCAELLRAASHVRTADERRRPGETRNRHVRVGWWARCLTSKSRRRR